MYPKNAASPPRIYVGPVVQISDGAVQTSDVAVTVTPEGGSETAGGGTIAYSSKGGVWYTPTQAETNYTAFMVEASKTGCIPVGVTVVTSATATAGQTVVATNNDKTGYGLADDAITASKFDESTAFPLKSADTGATAVARTGADSDTLETLSDQIDGVGGLDAAGVRTAIGLASANLDTQLGAVPAAVRDVSNAGPAAGSLGEKVNNAASAGDPLSSAVPGAYGAGTAGYILGTNLDAKVSEAGGGTAPTVEQIRAEMDSNSTKLTSIDAKTTNLPSDPADQSLIIAATDVIITAVGSPMQAGSSVAVSDKTGFKLASDGLDAVAAPADISTDAEARASFVSMVRALFNRMYNKVTQTSTQQVIHNDANSAVSTKPVTYDGVTRTLGKSS